MKSIKNTSKITIQLFATILFISCTNIIRDYEKFEVNKLNGTYIGHSSIYFDTGPLSGWNFIIDIKNNNAIINMTVGDENPQMKQHQLYKKYSDTLQLVNSHLYVGKFSEIYVKKNILICEVLEQDYNRKVKVKIPLSNKN